MIVADINGPSRLHQMYRLVSASYAGLAFPVPSHVWSWGEIKHSWAFNHPYAVEASGDRLVIASPGGDMQEWEAVAS